MPQGIKYSVEQIAGFLNEAANAKKNGTTRGAIAKAHGFAAGNFSKWERARKKKKTTISKPKAKATPRPQAQAPTVKQDKTLEAMLRDHDAIMQNIHRLQNEANEISEQIVEHIKKNL